MYAFQETFQFCNYLLSILPNSQFNARGKYDIKDIVQFCKNRDFSAILVVHEEKKVPGTSPQVGCAVCS